MDKGFPSSGTFTNEMMVQWQELLVIASSITFSEEEEISSFANMKQMGFTLLVPRCQKKLF
jgi:hypothetical protein